MSVSATCEFCREFTSGDNPFSNLVGDRVIWRDDAAVVFPTLGCFVEGYVLVCPIRHVLSVASLADNERAEFLQTVAAIRQHVGLVYGPTLLFEHGMAGGQHRSGGCIEHAHFHLVPMSRAGAEVALNSWSEHSRISAENLREFAETQYLAVSLPEEDDFLIAPAIDVPSQFFRRRVAATLGLEDVYDWAAAPHLDLLQATRDRLKLSFSLAE